MSPRAYPGRLQRRLAGRAAQAADEVDVRFRLAGKFREEINKIFPTHFSFLFGEIALYSFIVLLLSGTYLTFFFDPSLAEVTYHGNFTNLRGLEMSRAYESALQLSFAVRGGLFVRQMHHWAALVFLAAIMLHMGRIFFTGAFRKPRETNWMIGVTLLVSGLLEGYLGYSMIDDLLSGEGVRIFSGIILSVPVIGTWVHWIVFGGEFPGDIFVFRFYIAHVLLLPGLMLALIAVHLAVVWYQKHTQFAGSGRTEKNVVGVRVIPTFATHSLALMSGVAGVLAIMAGFFQINPVFNYGPFEPSQVSNGAEPDWYDAFLIGSLRMFPPWSIHLFHRWTIPAPFWAGVVIPLAMIGLLFAYPLLERRFGKDQKLHNLLQRPRDAPVRTGVGAMAVTFWFWLLLLGGDDILGLQLHLPIEPLVWTGRIGLLVMPPLAFLIAYKLCTMLQRSDREVLAHGIETGIVERHEGGWFVEVRQPLGGADARGRPIAASYDGAPVPKKVSQVAAAGDREPG